jgi:uncharacterized membrane protein YeaQ/YmgE (transglycosylase-associated protein family)
VNFTPLAFLKGGPGRGAAFELDSLAMFLLVGLAAGWIAGSLVGGRSASMVQNLVVGVVGAILGGVLFDLLGLKIPGPLSPLVIAVAGAVVLLLVVDFVSD